jgi:predicted metal-dependent phosphoesterase TrpH
MGEAHILGYFIDYKSPDLAKTLERFRNSRVVRAQAMVAKLRDMGINIKWERVQEIAGNASIGRPHIARAMMEKGYIGAVKDAFDGYLEHGGPAYVEREKMTPSEAVELIIASGGLPVLAHPFTVQKPEELIEELVARGLAGLEIYYKNYNEDEMERLFKVARKYNLIATGGSDYHGFENNNEITLGSAEVPLEAAQKLIALAGERALNIS